MSDIAKKLGKNIKKIRKYRELSQEQLAFASDLHRTYIGQVERGEKNITIRNVEKIAIALDIDIIDLFQYEDSKD